MNETKYDFTELVSDAMKNCQPYRKLDWAQINSDRGVAKYSIDEDQKELLEDNNVDTYEKYCTNKDEVEKAEEVARDAVLYHLKNCDVPSCKILNTARIDVSQGHSC